MPLVADQYKTLIVTKVGDTGVVYDNINTLWTMHDDKTPLELQYNYVLIEAIELLLGGAWQDYAYSAPGGGSVQMNQPFDHLISLASRADLRIKELVSNRSAVGVVTGRLTTKAPIATVPTPPDANDTQYGGDPNKMTGVTSGSGLPW